MTKYGMTRTTKTKAIILKRTNTGEADKIVTALTSDFGKVTFKASGIRRISSRRASHLELFNAVEVVLHKSDRLDSLSEANVIDSFPTLKSNLQLTSYGFYLSEVLDRILPDRQPSEKVFQMLYTCLQCLNDRNMDGRMAEKEVKGFVIKLLWELGYLPRQQYPKSGMTQFVEEIIERKVNSRKLLAEIDS